METPSALRSSTIRNSASTSFWVSDEVGSSKISTLQFAETAFAISTDCICDTLSVPTFCLGSKFMRTFLSSAAVSSFIFSWSTKGMPSTRLMG